jgi:hypothetical protein
MGDSDSVRSTIIEILGYERNRQRKPPKLDRVEQRFDSITHHDYAAALKAHFDTVQLTEILREVRSALPTLNRQVFSTVDLRELKQIAARMGVMLRADEFAGREGQELRGFYVHDRQLLKRPLICINRANHPVAVAASFWHEVGHHVTRRVFGEDTAAPRMNYMADHRQHLKEPKEILADLVMVLACYPKAAAKNLFGAGATLGLNTLLPKVRRHVRSLTSFDFTPELSTRENLYYLSTMIHVAELREALLFEYGI